MNPTSNESNLIIYTHLHNTADIKDKLIKSLLILYTFITI